MLLVMLALLLLDTLIDVSSSFSPSGELELEKLMTP